MTNVLILLVILSAALGFVWLLEFRQCCTRSITYTYTAHNPPPPVNELSIRRAMKARGLR